MPDLDLDDIEEPLEDAVQRHIDRAEFALSYDSERITAQDAAALARLADTHMRMAAWYEAHMPIPDILPSEEPATRGYTEGRKRLGD